MSFTHQIGPYPQSPAQPDFIDFRIGQPSPSLLPLEAIERAARRQLATDPLVLQYGTRRGYLPFREALAEFLSSRYHHPVSAAQLAVTAGNSLALSLASQVFGEPGRPVVCSDPTYFLAPGIFSTQRLEVVALPSDDGGFDVDLLEERLARGLRPSFVYCIPSFHNPTGVTICSARAERLVLLAERHDFLIVADEPYPLLHTDPAPPACMMTYDHGRGRVLALGSFSKILAPGVRLGWAHAAPVLIKRFMQHGALRSGGCLNPVMTRIVHGTLDDGFLEQHVDRLRGVLAGRARAMTEALITAGIEATQPRGGYFMWLDLGAAIDTTALLERCRAEHQVGFAPGARCVVSREASSCLRLSFSFYDEGEIAVGIGALAAAIDRMR